jgi:predicted nucleotidyltransferase
MTENGTLAADAGLDALPERVRAGIHAFVEAAREAFGADLRSVVLFGSAAEGRLRRTSDVNLMLVLARFERASADTLREPMRIARAALNLNVLFLREAEIPLAKEAFALKFSDVRQRRRVLLGSDPFAGLEIPRAARLSHLKQVLLNLELRLRAVYVERSLREEQLARVLADEAGPLRAAAAALLELEDGPSLPPKPARVAAESGRFDDLLEALSRSRDSERLPAGEAPRLCFRLLDLLEAMQSRVARLSSKRS